MDKEFREFQTSKLFDIHPTKAYKMSNGDLYKTDGKTPVLSNSSTNNGIGGYCGLEPTETGNIITFSDTTTGTDTMFYQPNAFVGYPHIQGMYPYDKEHWNEKECLYFISVMKTACGKGWSYSNKFTRVFVLDTTPSLPIKTDENGNPVVDDKHKYHNEGFIPDFEYMEKYIEKLEQERIEELERYLVATGLNDYELTNEDIEILSLSGLGNYKKLDNGDAVKVYKEFVMKDLFEKQKTLFKGNGRKQDSVSKTLTQEFSLPMINCKNGDNGIMYYGRRADFSVHTNVLTIIYNGPPTEGQTYWQEEIGLLTDAYIIDLCDDRIINRRLGLYLATAINKSIHNLEKKKYSRGNKATWDSKVEYDFIELPIQTNANNVPVIDETRKYHPDGYIPDWDFMEKYIKAIEKIVIADVVKFKDTVINRTKEVVN